MKNHYKCVLILAVLCWTMNSFAQSDSINVIDEVYDSAEVMPVYPGGFDSLRLFIQNYLQYPIMAIEEEIQGKVVISFVIGADGQIRDIMLLESAGAILDNEALRLIKLMPPWVPAQKGGKAVAVKFKIPIIFKLEISPPARKKRKKEKIKEKSLYN